MKKNVLIVSGHPNLKSSLANRTILDEVQKALPEVTINRLDVLYPNYEIDVPAEQAKLVAADIVVWQFPLQWFSVPALMKKYFDDVLLHGFAYGSKGVFLKGKKGVLSFTAGGEGTEYNDKGCYHHTLEAFVMPLKEIFPFINMDYSGAVYSADADYFEGISRPEQRDEVIARSRQHAQELVELLNKLLAGVYLTEKP